MGYQQLTLFTEYSKEITNELDFQLRLSFDVNDSEHPAGEGAFRSHREDEYYTRLMFNWVPQERHQLAFGAEISHEQYGKRSPGYPHLPAYVNNDIPATVGKWESETYSFLSEYQWTIDGQWTVFAGLRIDDNSNFEKTILSPRLAFVYTPTETDTIKLIYNQSNRLPAASARIETIANDTEDAEPEIIDYYELRWERQQNEGLWIGFSGYYADHEVTGHNADDATTEILGDLSYYGLELEVMIQRESYTISLAHNFTKLIDFDLADPTLNRQHVSASDYGYGSDFANWSNHQTTLSGRYLFSDRWTGTASITALWGYPGARDYADYGRDNNIGSLGIPRADVGKNRAFKESIFVNAGVEYSPKDDLTLRLDAYNMLGWLDKDYNKRNVFYRSSLYQDEAAAVAFTVRKTF